MAQTYYELLGVAENARDAEIEAAFKRSEEHTSELQSQSNLVCRLLLEKKKLTCKSHPPAGRLLLALLPAILDGAAACVIQVLGHHVCVPGSSMYPLGMVSASTRSITLS